MVTFLALIIGFVLVGFSLTFTSKKSVAMKNSLPKIYFYSGEERRSRKRYEPIFD